MKAKNKAKKLFARIKDWQNTMNQLKNKSGYHKPGSNKK